MLCPLCRSYNTGKTENNIYYCSYCLLGFSPESGDEVSFYYFDEEGSILNIKNKYSAKQLSHHIREENNLSSQILNQFLQEKDKLNL